MPFTGDTFTKLYNWLTEAIREHKIQDARFDAEFGGIATGLSELAARVTASTGAPAAPQGRLALTSSTPVMATSVAGATTVYYTPYTGQFIPLYNGSSLAMHNLGGELSQTTTDSTKSPAAVAASKVYDIFVWLDGATYRATRGPAWTNDSTRSNAVQRQNGIWLNQDAVTNGPAAFRGTYVGTIRSNASSTIDWTFGAAASGGTAASLNVWNTYNRVSVGTAVVDNGAAYTYTSTTIRQARASAGNQIAFVLGLQEESVFAAYVQRVDTVSVQNANGVFGLGIDSTTTYAGQRVFAFTNAAALNVFSAATAQSFQLAAGVHIISANEHSDGSNANTFDNNNTATLSALLRM